METGRMSNPTISFTGHRPNKLPDPKTGYDLSNPLYQWLTDQIIDLLKTIKPSTIISGMALGIDSLAAQIAIDLDIPFIAAIPFKGQESKWPSASQKRYHMLLKAASKVVVVSEGAYSAEKMQIRNVWMVDNSDGVIAIWDGTAGGTANCVQYAESINKQIWRINPKDFQSNNNPIYKHI